MATGSIIKSIKTIINEDNTTFKIELDTKYELTAKDDTTKSTQFTPIINGTPSNWKPSVFP